VLSGGTSATGTGELIKQGEGTKKQRGKEKNNKKVMRRF
jgi:hypothetical protein